MQLECWYWLSRILARKAALKLLVFPHSIYYQIVVKEIFSLQSISTDRLELYLYPLVWVQTIPIVPIQIPIKLIHREQKNIGIAPITHPQINRFFILPLQQVFCKEKWRWLMKTTIIFLIDRKNSVYKFDWMQGWIQTVNLYEFFIWTSVCMRLIRSLIICVK